MEERDDGLRAASTVDEMTDERRGRAFLERLLSDGGEDGTMAAAAIHLVLEGARPPGDVDDEWCAALGRVLRGSE